MKIDLFEGNCEQLFKYLLIKAQQGFAVDGCYVDTAENRLV